MDMDDQKLPTNLTPASEVKTSNPLKRGRGRPKGTVIKYEYKEEDKERVMLMTATGVPHTIQAKIIGCGVNTLRKYFMEELDTGKTKANAEVSKALFSKAMEGNVTAQIFWLKSQAGWVDTQRLEVKGVTTNKLSETELKQRLAHLATAAKMGTTLLDKPPIDAAN